MVLKIPSEALEAIKKLADLSDDKIDAYLVALKESGPQFNVQDLAQEAARRSKIEGKLSYEVASVLAALYRSKDEIDATLEGFVDDELRPSLKSSEIVSPSQWPRLRKFLLEALALDNTVGTASKAGFILTEHERIFREARVMCDIRPIFHLDVDEQPNAALVIHMLRVEYRDRHGKVSSECFALDSTDLRSLKAVLERAIKKEETLTKVMDGSGVKILTPKAFF